MRRQARRKNEILDVERADQVGVQVQHTNGLVMGVQQQRQHRVHTQFLAHPGSPLRPARIHTEVNDKHRPVLRSGPVHAWPVPHLVLDHTSPRGQIITSDPHSGFSVLGHGDTRVITTLQ